MSLPYTSLRLTIPPLVRASLPGGHLDGGKDDFRFQYVSATLYPSLCRHRILPTVQSHVCQELQQIHVDAIQITQVKPKARYEEGAVT